MEKIVDKVNEMIDAKEWNDEKEAFILLTGDVTDGKIMAALRGTTGNLIATLTAHMIERKEIEVIVKEAVYQFIKEMEKKRRP